MSTPTPSTNPLLRAWYDKETRSIIVQIIAAALILSFFAYIINNAVVNLAAIGKDISFNFLWQNASYDINQHLIEYSSTSNHFTAMIVGLINTLLVAAAGIVLATMLGFMLGVMRLSNNWLTQKNCLRLYRVRT
jgi:general L-amino acid transport system permease protein